MFSLNKRLSRQSWGQWFETLSCPLWRHCNGLSIWHQLPCTRWLVFVLWINKNRMRQCYITRYMWWLIIVLWEYKNILSAMLYNAKLLVTYIGYMIRNYQTIIRVTFSALTHHNLICWYWNEAVKSKWYLARWFGLNTWHLDWFNYTNCDVPFDPSTIKPKWLENLVKSTMAINAKSQIYTTPSEPILATDIEHGLSFGISGYFHQIVSG